MKLLTWKKITVFSILLSIIFIVSACGTSSSTTENANSNGKIKLKFASYFAGTSPVYYGFVEPWMEKVTELTDGQVEFDYYPSEQLGKATDLLDLTKNGVADIGIIASDYNPDTMPLTAFLSSYPYLSQSVNQGTLALNKLIHENETLKEIDFTSNGVYPLMSIVAPGEDIWTIEKEVRTPDDIKGLRIRSKGGTINSLYEHLGATPMSISFPETYEALERGVVDGVATYNMAIKNGGFDELVNYMTPLQIGAVNQTVVINERVWQGLPENVQEAMREAANNVITTVGAVYDEEINEFIASFESDATIIELNEDEMKQWTDVFNEWGENWLEANKDKGIPYEEILEEYREYLAEFE